MKVFKTLLKTELKLSLRGMDMFIFAICMPVLVTVILGFIYGDKPAFPGADFTFFLQQCALQYLLSFLNGNNICLGKNCFIFDSNHI